MKKLAPLNYLRPEKQMPTFTIDAPVVVKKSLPASGKYKPKTIYTLTLVDENQQPTLGVELMQNEDTSPPEVGETIEGELSQDQYGWKFKKNFDGRSRASADAGGGYQRDPKERDSIVRQHSQHMAILYVAVQQKKSPELNPNLPYLQGLIDWFSRDAKGEAQP